MVSTEEIIQSLEFYGLNYMKKKYPIKFLSWGWREKGGKVIPLSKFKNFNIKKTTNNELLVMLKNRQRYFYSMDSSGGTESFSSYLNFISSFIFKLKSSTKNRTILRLPTNEDIKSFDIYSKLEKKFNFRTSNSLINAFSKSKLIIHTLISTSINDALNANLPSIILIRKDHNPINLNAKKKSSRCYMMLTFYLRSNKSRKFVDTIWDNNRVDLWGTKEKLKMLLKSFVNILLKTTHT